MPLLAAARTPPDLRIYAIGDVHGQLQQLRDIHDAIAQDLRARPVTRSVTVHVGDYVDRGPDSRGVLQFLIGRMAADPGQICLLGNHDRAFFHFTTDHPDAWKGWLTYGGAETCVSYGIERGEIRDTWRGRPRLRQRLAEIIPPDHLAFLDRPAFSIRLGDYFFVHAGVDPRRGLDEQRERDLIWIREPFLSWTEDFGAVVVHGHTPVGAPTVKPNRIDIDTGAGYDGPITTLVLEGCEQGFLNGSYYDPF